MDRGEQPVVTWVGPEALAAGLKPGAVITGIGGQSARDVLDEICLETSASTEHGLRARASMSSGWIPGLKTTGS